jgi:hypothetical protein
MLILIYLKCAILSRNIKFMEIKYTDLDCVGSDFTQYHCYM